MKIITNKAICTQCGFDAGVILSNGIPVCKKCRSTYLIDANGKPFKPVFGGPQTTYKASKYTPEMRCRRSGSGAWPKMKERRLVA